MRHLLQLIFITTAVMLGFLYFAAPDCVLHQAACIGLPTDLPIAPTVYRILPTAVNRFLALTTPESVLLGNTLLQMLCVMVIMPLLYRWLNRSIEGVMIFGVVWLMAFHFWWLSVGITFEVLFVMLALTLVNRTWLWTAALVALASLNRETAVLLVGIYAAYHGRSRWRETFALLAVWAGITAFLHLVIGSYPHMLGAVGTLQYNLNTLLDAIIANLLLMPLAVAAWIGRKRATPRLQRFAAVALMYVAAVVVGGAWSESQRLLLPALPLILPVMFVSEAAYGRG